MKKLTTLLIALVSFGAVAQTTDWKKAPNSYVYDVQLAKTNNYGGIFIPVRKAYENWANYTYLKTNGVSTPIPAGTLTASLYWEDLPGLISNVSIQPAANPQDSKIKVEINEARGKGNAVIAFKVDGNIYWSWHIWVTDNPENGVVYKQGYETDIDMNPIEGKYMDRNLGAVNKNFNGNNWDKSGGLMYEWGRKDPFPPLAYKDTYFYELNGEVGSLKHKSIDPINTIPVVVRPNNEIEKNIQYSIKNPITYIVNTDATGNWFSNQRYKVAGTNTVDYISWDLWSDNAKGNHSNANSSSVALKNESRSYELKSELDPCPNGWRVPSYYGRVTVNNNLSPWGRIGNWNNDDPTDYAKLLPNAQNPVLDGIKVYPGIGMDFTNAQGGGRNMGIQPVAGGYVYYPNAVSPNAPVGVVFQDNASNGGLWSATFGYDGARLYSMISDPFRTNTAVGLHAIYINQTNPTRSGNAVRCMKDPNLLKIGNFTTEYFAKEKPNFAEGLDLPNSYIVNGNTIIKIPVMKAFSVYNQLLTDHQELAVDKLVAKVLWTTNPNFIKRIKIIADNSFIANSVIEVEVNPDAYENAVISLHDGDTKSKALWSWHIWNPKANPDTSTISYTTEANVVTQFNFVNATVSKLPKITTEFMSLNLGAIYPMSAAVNSESVKKSFGMHYQWGRKDALPNFGSIPEEFSGAIFLGSENSSENGILEYTKLNEQGYTAFYTSPYSSYSGNLPSKYKKALKSIEFSVNNPMNFLYQNGYGTLYDGGNANNNNLSLVKDWVLDERNQIPERWGHADKKSPYDPCPAGWRIPDVSFTNLYTGSKGNSPWFNGYNNDAYGKPGVIQNQWHSIPTYYGGTVIPNLGWVFGGSTYKIGNFPADGIRGELGENGISYARSGVWTASLADRGTGYALAMQFQGDKLQTGTGVYPQAAMGVRCARDYSVSLGKVSGNPAAKKSENNRISETASSEITVFYNDLSSTIDLSTNEANYFEIFDFSGRLLKNGSVSQNKISGVKLEKGAYLVKLALKNGKSTTKKILVK